MVSCSNFRFNGNQIFTNENASFAVFQLLFLRLSSRLSNNGGEEIATSSSVSYLETIAFRTAIVVCMLNCRIKIYFNGLGVERREKSFMGC